MFGSGLCIERVIMYTGCFIPDLPHHTAFNTPRSSFYSGETLHYEEFNVLEESLYIII